MPFGETKKPWDTVSPGRTPMSMIVYAGWATAGPHDATVATNTAVSAATVRTFLPSPGEPHGLALRCPMADDTAIKTLVGPRSSYEGESRWPVSVGADPRSTRPSPSALLP